MFDIKEAASRYLLPAGLLGVITISGLVVSSLKPSESFISNANFDSYYNQVPGDSTTHDEYYLIGKVSEEPNGYFSIGIDEIIYSPNEVKELRVKKDDLPRIPETSDILVLKVLLGADEYGLPKKSFSYILVGNKEGF
ncbi:hypothetical protein HYT57_05095 [Candidatus Woesearchaeota archaeon]|nr:hypothetical protein [Candidatus Woesearchaeota archaeon]